MTATARRSKLEIALPGLLLLSLGLLWGFGFALAKIAVNHGIAPLGYVYWQTAAGGTILLAIACLMGQRPRASRIYLRYYVLIGLFALAAPNAIGYTVLARIPVSIWALVINFVPLFTYTVALVVGYERVQPIRLAGIAFGLAGALLLIVPDASLPDRSMVPWVVLGVATPLLYAISNVLMATMRPASAPSLGLAAGMTLAASAILLPVTFATGSFYLPDPSALTLGDAALIGQVFITASGYVIFHEIQRLAGPVFAGFVGFIVTLSGLMWGMVLFGEQPSSWIYLSLVLILAGMALVNFGGRLALRKPTRSDD